MVSTNEMKIVEAPFFVVDMVRRSLSERFFSWPWRPWIKSYPVNTPSMVKIGNEIFCHPDLAITARHLVTQCEDSGDECRNCQWTWDSATSNGMCEFCEKRQWFDEDTQE